MCGGGRGGGWVHGIKDIAPLMPPLSGERCEQADQQRRAPSNGIAPSAEGRYFVDRRGKLPDWL